MGIYVCNDCLDEHKLECTMFGAIACCEICGPIKGDWDNFKSLKWVPILRRLEDVKKQLENYKLTTNKNSM